MLADAQLLASRSRDWRSRIVFSASVAAMQAHFFFG